MKLYLFSFSPTGGTEKVLRALAGGFEAVEEKIFVDLTDRRTDFGVISLRREDADDV